MGLTSTAVCASFLLATLLLSATLDCARKQDTHVLLEYRCADRMWAPMVYTNGTLVCCTYDIVIVNLVEVHCYGKSVAGQFLSEHVAVKQVGGKTF